MKQIKTIEGKRYLILGFEIFNFNRREETYSDIVRNARGMAFLIQKKNMA